MKIAELQDKQGKVDIDLKIIWDQSPAKEVEYKGQTNKLKSVIVVDADAQQGDGSPSAYLTLYNDQIDNFKQFDKVRVTNAFSQLMQNEKKQFRIVNADKIEKIEE